MVGTAVAVKTDSAAASGVSKDELIRDLVLVGDLSRFSPDQKVELYQRMCDALELNPVTRPFDFMVLQGKTVLYAKKDATDQLRKKFGISVIDMKKEVQGDLYIVTVKVQDSTGRVDLATGILDIGGKKGNDLANLMMKCETKAKRRATLSIGGLGILDETELDTIPASPDISTTPKPHGNKDAAIKVINSIKTEAELDSCTKRIALSEWSEQEAIELDDALKNAIERVKEVK